MTETIQEIATLPINQIVTGKAKRAIHEESLKELTDSIKAQGVLQPILVRPVDGKHELVFGRRRLMAARAVGLAAIPAMVREMTDAQVLEAQIIENCQRQDIHPMEEAESYRVLHEKYGHHVEDIAAKVGKSRAYIYGRLKLCALTEKARRAFLDDGFSASTALLIARIPVPELQEKAAKEISLGRYGWDRNPMSYREAFEHIQRNYMLRLHDAQFPKGDAELLPAAGPCSSCAKRTGNQPELFADIKSTDVCTDPKCYQQKLDAHWERIKAEASDKGYQVLSEKESKKKFSGSYLGGRSGLVELSNRCFQDPKQRTYKQLLAKIDFERVYARDGEGNIRELAPESAVKKALAAAGLKASRSTGSSPNSANGSKIQKLRKLVARRALEAICEAVEKKKPDAGFWRLLVVLLVPSVHSVQRKQVFKRWALKTSASYDPRAEYKTHVDNAKKLTEAQARNLIVELLLEERLEYMTGSYPGEILEAARYFRVDLKRLEASVKAEATPKKKVSTSGGKKRTSRKKRAA